MRLFGDRPKAPVIKFKKLHPDAVIPTRATDGSAGFDLYVHSTIFDTLFDTLHIKTGVACEIPKGYVGLLAVRSSTHKKGFQLANQIGIIDSDFRGEITVVLKDNGLNPIKRDGRINIGDRIAQLVIVPCLTRAEETDTLSPSERGAGGFGSTDVSASAAERFPNEMRKDT